MKRMIISVKDAEENGWKFLLDGSHPYKYAWRNISPTRALLFGLIERALTEEECEWESFIEIALVQEPKEGAWTRGSLDNPFVRLTTEHAFARWGTAVAKAVTLPVFGESWESQYDRFKAIEAAENGY